MKDTETFSIRKTTAERIPRLPFEAMKDAALGRGYSLSLVFCGEKLMRKLNRIHRGKNSATDILSFPLDAKSGEIFISAKISRAKAKEFGRPFENFLQFLFIHGLVHLKGFDHGSKMEAEESKVRRHFKV